MSPGRASNTTEAGRVKNRRFELASPMSRWTRESGRIIAALFLLLGAVGASAAESDRVPRLVDEPCDFEVADDAVAARLRCARLVVHRDPQRPENGTFDLAVVVKRSAEPKPDATPVLFLHGGPGGQMTRYLGRSPRDFVPGHDLVGFDMRGGGRSTPRVCDEAFGQLVGAFVHREGPAAAAAERRRIADACLGDFRAAGLDATYFGTALNVADAEALRAALGVERWLLLGESYGTAVAAHYVATHPERIAAAVLDSLYPADQFVPPAAEMQGRLIERLAADCTRDAACAQRWPDFGRAQLDAAVAALDVQPLAVGHGDGRRLVDGLALRQLLMAVGAFEAGVRSLPLLLDAAVRRDAAMLAGPVRMFDASGGGAVNLASMAATDCRDRARHHQHMGLEDPMSVLSGLPSEFCRDWASPAAAPRWPVDSAVPMLVLAGGYDGLQPPAAAVVATLGPSARLVEIPHAAHGTRGAGPCVRDLVGAFLATPDAALDAGCVDAMTPPPFLTSVVPLPGPSQLLSSMGNGSPPPSSLLLAGLAVLLGIALAIVATWRRWRRSAASSAQALRWTWAAAIAGLVGIAGPTALVATTDPMASAALIYGVPAGWGWLPWLGLLPASVGVLAIWRGGAWAPRVAGIAAILVSVAMAVGGWSVFG